MNFIGQKINTRCINYYCMSKAFRQLQADELETIDLNRTEITYKKGESLCKQGSFMSYMMFVKSGMVKVYIENEEKSKLKEIFEYRQKKLIELFGPFKS